MSIEPLIFDLSSPGRIGFSLPEVDMDEAPALDAVRVDFTTRIAMIEERLLELEGRIRPPRQ